MYAQGEFTGRSGHTLIGSFTLERADDGFRMTTGADFFFDAATPGPAWGLGDPDRPPYPALLGGSVWLELEPFAPISGPHAYVIPGTYQVTTAPAIIAWCTVLNLPLGEGRLLR